MKLKNSIFIIFCLALFIPVIQSSFSVFHERPLQGSFVSVDKPTLKYARWMNGSYQDSIELYLKENIGLGSFLIRLNNQLDYSLFNKSNAKKTIVGKSGFLFEESYIYAHRGDDFQGRANLSKRIKKLKLVQDQLQDMGIEFVFIIAPGKASFHEEYIPDYYHMETADSTNYETVHNELILQNINHIDFGQYFLEIKQQSPYPLFPKNGIHWSYYGVTLVMDSIANYIEKKSNLDLVDFTSNEGIIVYNSNEIRGTDSDIGNALNLLHPPKSNILYYPDVVFNSSKKDKPNLLSIGDSFNNSFFNLYPYYSKLFSDSSRFWYYNQTVNWPESVAAENIAVKSLNVKQEIESRDIIMIVSTEQNLGNPGFGFQDFIYPNLLPDSVKDTEENLRLNKINEIVNRIKGDPEWLKAIQQKAVNNNISLEDQIRLDAEWMLDHQ